MVLCVGRVCLLVCPACLSVCLSDGLFICLSVRLFVQLDLCLTAWLGLARV
jgi:hypothetical protein